MSVRPVIEVLQVSLRWPVLQLCCFASAPLSHASEGPEFLAFGVGKTAFGHALPIPFRFLTASGVPFSLAFIAGCVLLQVSRQGQLPVGGKCDSLVLHDYQTMLFEQVDSPVER